MQITKFDKFQTRVLQGMAVDALNAALAKNGVRVEEAGGQINGESATLKFKFTATSPEAVAQQDAKVERELQLLGLENAKLGAVFESRGTSYRISGVELGRPKFPIQADRVHDGRRFKFPVDTVRRALAARA